MQTPTRSLSLSLLVSLFCDCVMLTENEERHAQRHKSHSRTSLSVRSVRVQFYVAARPLHTHSLAPPQEKEREIGEMPRLFSFILACGARCRSSGHILPKSCRYARRSLRELRSSWSSPPKPFQHTFATESMRAEQGQLWLVALTFSMFLNGDVPQLWFRPAPAGRMLPLNCRQRPTKDSFPLVS